MTRAATSPYAPLRRRWGHRRFSLGATLMRAISSPIVLILVLQAALASAQQRPNIVAIVADDLGWADVPWHGSQYRMPHLTRLAEKSVRLEAHYVHPMCSPTRAAF